MPVSVCVLLVAISVSPTCSSPQPLVTCLGSAVGARVSDFGVLVSWAEVRVSPGLSWDPSGSPPRFLGRGHKLLPGAQD